ncbi:8337_t:CDS:1, partial [Gigaspora margarita]
DRMQNSSFDTYIGANTIQDSILKNNFLAKNVNDKNIDLELCQHYKSKICALQCLVEHLNNELSANNLQHVEGMVNIMKHIFTIINDIESSQCKCRHSETLKKSKPWTLFL